MPRLFSRLGPVSKYSYSIVFLFIIGLLGYDSFKLKKIKESQGTSELWRK